MIGKWLRIFFGCHGMRERSFVINGKQFPICARCTGLLAGFFAGIIFFIIFGVRQINLLIIVSMISPLVIDGAFQRFTKYRSNNIKRFISGILCGIAVIMILINIHLFTVSLAMKFLDWQNIPYSDKWKNLIP